MAMSRFVRSPRSRRYSRTMTSRASRRRNPRRRRHSFRKRPNAHRFARRGCRNSRICRCRRRTKFARPAATPKASTRRRPACRCCSASPMSGSAADRRARRRSGHAADAAAAGAQGPAHGRPANRRQRAGVGICPAAAAEGIGRSWSASACCIGATGRRPSRYPSLSAPPGELKIVTIQIAEKVPVAATGTFVILTATESQGSRQAVGNK